MTGFDERIRDNPGSHLSAITLGFAGKSPLGNGLGSTSTTICSPDFAFVGIDNIDVRSGKLAGANAVSYTHLDVYKRQLV